MLPIPDAAYMYLDNNVEIAYMEVYHFIDCHIIWASMIWGL